MARRRTTQAISVGRRRSAAALAVLGGRVAAARRNRGWTQRELAERLGITQARQSQIEAGFADGLPAHLWFAISEVLGVPLRFELGRDPLAELEDSGHLELQEFMLELGRLTGRARSFELQVKPAPGHSIDVGLRDDALRLLVLQECWNTFTNLGSSVRNTHRKLVELEALAVAAGGAGGAYAIRACWVVRDAPRNREIVARYPDIFRTTFPTRSRDWVQSLTHPGAMPPNGLGFIWCDPRAKRLSELRF